MSRFIYNNSIQWTTSYDRYRCHSTLEYETFVFWFRRDDYAFSFSLSLSLSLSLYDYVRSHRRFTSASRLWYDFNDISTFHRLFTDRDRHTELFDFNLRISSCKTWKKKNERKGEVRWFNSHQWHVNEHEKWDLFLLTVVWHDECSFHVNKARLWYEFLFSHSTISLLTQITRKQYEKKRDRKTINAANRTHLWWTHS
jgi:hypothetical protein